jgi:hypothetical protein
MSSLRASAVKLYVVDEIKNDGVSIGVQRLNFAGEVVVDHAAT